MMSECYVWFISGMAIALLYSLWVFEKAEKSREE